MAPSSLPSPASLWGCRGGSPTLPWAEQRCLRFGAGFCSKVERDAPHRWISPQGEAPVVLPGKGLEFLEAHAGCGRAQCALCPRGVLFSLNKPLDPSSGAQAPRCPSLPCVWQEQRAFSMPRLPTAGGASMTAVKPGQEMSRDTKTSLLSFGFYFRVVLQQQLCLLQRFIFLLAGLDAGSCQAKGLCKPGTTKQADTSNELQ